MQACPLGPLAAVLVVVGCGRSIRPLPAGLAEQLREKGLTLEVLDTVSALLIGRSLCDSKLSGKGSTCGGAGHGGCIPYLVAHSAD